jgi:hypothetical protein
MATPGRSGRAGNRSFPKNRIVIFPKPVEEAGFATVEE